MKHGILIHDVKDDVGVAVRDLATGEDGDPQLAAFYKQRMQNMQRFFNSLDNIVATLLALDNLRLNSLAKLFGNKGANSEQAE